MKFTEDQLMNMPIGLLRNVDIRSKEEEELVQKVWNKRQVTLPVDINFSFPSSTTDNMTIEKERELQAEIDARKAEKMEKILGEDATPTLEGDAENEKEKFDEVTPQVVVDPVIVEVPKDEPVVTESKRFCEFCDSKGVRHKKDCTRIVS